MKKSDFKKLVEHQSNIINQLKKEKREQQESHNKAIVEIMGIITKELRGK